MACVGGSSRPVVEAPPLPPGPPAIAERMRAASGEPLGFALGINEGLSVPARHRGDLSGAELATALGDDARLVRGLGAAYVRGHTGNFPPVSCSELARRPGVFPEMDAWVRALGSDLVGVAMVSPWPGNRTGNYTESYVPDDLPAYQRCVSELVERYDGDGLEDMPGLSAPIRYWEVDNEPDLKNSNLPARSRRAYDPKTFCKPDEYATVLVATSAAIRAADPEARILALGLYRPHAELGLAYGRAVLDQPGVLESFDILSLHTYADDDGETLARGIAKFRALVYEKPIWVTEASVSMSKSTEAEQGRRVAAYVASAARAGAERLFWHTLADPPAGRGGDAGLFSTNSLMRTAGSGAREDKPAGAVYRNLSARLAVDDLTGAVPEGEGAVRARSGAVLLYRGARTAEHGGTDLVTGLPVEPGAVAAAPAWLNSP